MFFVFVLALSVGSSMLPVGEVFLCVMRIRCSGVVEKIVELRLSRSTVAFLTGALLALSGVVMQAIARNPLAEPYILGLSSTALTFLAVAIIVSPGIVASRYLMAVVTFLGAFTGYVLTTALSIFAGGTSLALILSGIAVTMLFSGISHVLLYIVQSRLKFPYHLLLTGSAATALTSDVYILTATLFAGVAAIYLTGLPKKLNAYVFGDTFAKQLGYNPKILSITSALLVSVLTGVCVAVVGIVGFVGLVAPHIARLLLGTADHRVTLVTAIMIGAVLTLAADIGARILAIATAQGEFPLGVVTSLIGAPFLAYLIVRGGRR